MSTISSRLEQLGRHNQEREKRINKLTKVTRKLNDAYVPWTAALPILQEELLAVVRPNGGTVDVAGPCGIASNVYVTVKPTKRSRPRYMTVRPDNIGTDKFCLMMVSDEATGDYRPNTIGAINGLNYRETAPVVSAAQLLSEMERRFRQDRKQSKTNEGGKE